MSSRRSVSSGGMSSSGRIRNPRNADIDHTLFGNSSGRKTRSASGRSSSSSSSSPLSSSSAVVSSSLVSRLINADHHSNNAAITSKDTVVISTEDLAQIKNATLALGLNGCINNNNNNNNYNNNNSDNNNNNNSNNNSNNRFCSNDIRSATFGACAKSRARKERMMKMEKERLANGEPSNEIEAEEEEKRTLLLNRAKGAMDEELDDVKHMNQMTLYAKCVTIRDAQILEKQKIEEELIAEEKRLDMAMEVERVKTLKMQEEREAARLAEQRMGASVIIKQIAEREAERIRQQELREQEAQQMLQRVIELEATQEQERLAKVAAGRKLLVEVMEANNAQARAKLRRRQEEQEEDARITEYLRQKETREREAEAELERIRAEKEHEIARLRAAQERAQDRQAAIDELRAKRYQEAKDREWRKQQLEQAVKRESIRQEIGEAREAQRAEKARRIAEQALQEREEYMRVLDWQKQQNDNDQKKIENAASKANQHRIELLAQIEAHRAEKAEAKARYLEEGKQIALQQESEKKKLLRLKQQKLEQLEKSGVPEKYRAELAKKKVLVASIH